MSLVASYVTFVQWCLEVLSVSSRPTSTKKRSIQDYRLHPPYRRLKREKRFLLPNFKILVFKSVGKWLKKF